MRLKQKVIGLAKACLDELEASNTAFDEKYVFHKLIFRFVTVPQVAIRWCDPDSNAYGMMRSALMRYPECSAIHMSNSNIEVEYDNLSGQTVNGLGTSDDIFKDSARIIGVTKKAYKLSRVSEVILDRVKREKSDLCNVLDTLNEILPGSKEAILGSSCFIGALDGAIKTAKECIEKGKATSATTEQLDQMSSMINQEIERLSFISDEYSDFIANSMQSCYFYIDFNDISIADLKDKIELVIRQMQKQIDALEIGYYGLAGDIELMKDFSTAIDTLREEIINFSQNKLKG